MLRTDPEITETLATTLRGLHGALGFFTGRVTGVVAGARSTDVEDLQRLVARVLKEAGLDDPKPNHQRDEDCEPFLESPGIDDSSRECLACGVGHGDPCPRCSGRGFHRDDCPEIG